MQRRNGYDIIFEILSLAFDGTSRTKLMHQCNLNYGRTDRYLKLLLNYGLLIGENDNPKKFLVFKLTPGGLELLSALSSVRKLLPKKIKLKRLNGT